MSSLDYDERCATVAKAVLRAIDEGGNPVGPLTYQSKLLDVDPTDVLNLIRDLAVVSAAEG